MTIRIGSSVERDDRLDSKGYKAVDAQSFLPYSSLLLSP
jgi:hypothetical protein